MALRKTIPIQVPNSLVASLVQAPEDIVQELVQMEEARAEKEFCYAIIELFCRKIEAGVCPPLCIQQFVARILRDALKNKPVKNLLGVTNDIGRRDFWLSTTIWSLEVENHSAMHLYRIVAGRWNARFSTPNYTSIHSKTAERASRRFSWLDSHRHHFPQFILTKSNGWGIDLPAERPIKLVGKTKVEVPGECLVEVPRDSEVPIDLHHARSLCRSFCYAVEKCNGVVLPGLLPYFARAFRETMNGLSLVRALRLDRDRSGRPPRGGALEGWPTKKPQDRRDLWLAAEIYWLREGLSLRNGYPRTGEACRLASEKWSLENPKYSVNKDTARTAWKRWREYVEWVEPAIKTIENERQQRDKIEEFLMAHSGWHFQLWQTLLRSANSDGCVSAWALKSIAGEFPSIMVPKFDEMLQVIEGRELLVIETVGKSRQVRILGFPENAIQLGAPGPISTNSGYHLQVAADLNCPIYQPSQID